MSTKQKDIAVALAGQQNAGKSTTFNMLTGARQHVANYPGVTVDKKYGYYRDDQGSVQTIDLPGTYSLTAFSLEERVARDYLLNEKPDVVVNVVDASNLRRSLHLTLQIMEMQLPTILAVNMMDIARGRGLQIDCEVLGQRLGFPAIATVGRKGEGKKELQQAIRGAVGQPVPKTLLHYGELESDLSALVSVITSYESLQSLPPRWLALKLLEKDSIAIELVQKALQPDQADALISQAQQRSHAFLEKHQLDVTDHVIACREQKVRALLDGVLTGGDHSRPILTDRIDRVLLHRWGAPLFLVATVFLIYQIAIVWGYELTKYTWPFLAGFRELVAGVLPDAGFLVDPYTRALGLWLVDSANTLLNYVPIFLILFALIAILEDSGYMARIAFILDKILHRFGMHGQSTLPLILGGVFAGGCAVPGVMATKGIPDNRARMATILTVPFMNCLAKVPLYTLLLGIFFVEHRSLMMFYIATMTIVFALLVSKLLTKTVLRAQETAPFVMELPAYHVPTLRGVLQRSFERTWMYIKKVGFIVVAVAVVVFTLLQFPGLPDERKAHFEVSGQQAVLSFQQAMDGNPYAQVAQGQNLVSLLNYYNDFKRAKLNASGADASRAVNETFEARNPEFFIFVKASKGDKAAREAGRALKQLASASKSLRREMKEERITYSILGNIGRSLEPVTQYAGFDWKINVALLSSFAARESSVATLGVLFQQNDDQNATLEERMGAETMAGGATSLLAVSMILFFALYPPCLATTVMVKVQTGSYKWMLFSIVFPTILGLSVSSLVFTLGTLTGASGIQAISLVYFSALALLLLVGLGGREKRPSFDPAGAALEVKG